MIFNKNRNGADELHSLTGSFAANNNFDSIVSDIELETQSVIRYIGMDVYNRAEDSYTNSIAEDVELVRLVQRPIALLATLRYLQSNLTTHGDSGRKVLIDNDNQKMAFEWMVDRDDTARLQKAYKAIDVLIGWLEANVDTVTEWENSDPRKMRNQLLVNSLERFEQTYFIDGSYRFYYILCPLMLEVQTKLLGNETIDSELRELACSAIVLQTMSVALTRFAITVLPEGVVRQFSPSTQTTKASESARTDAIDRAVRQLRTESQEYMSQLRIKQQKIDNPYADNNLMPKNSPDNKFFSL